MTAPSRGVQFSQSALPIGPFHKDLHVVAARAAEHEGRARKRIVAQNLHYVGGESVETAPHVDGRSSLIHVVGIGSRIGEQKWSFKQFPHTRSRSLY